jgi:hypothetical protein
VLRLSVTLHRRVAWLALAAMWLLALVPTVSHALAVQRAAANGVAWTEVCTPQGMRLIAVDASGDLVEPGASDPGAPTPTPDMPVSTGGHLEHCAWCAPSLTPPLPVALTVHEPAVGPSPPLPAAFLHAPTTAHVWACANPRAPPARS